MRDPVPLLLNPPRDESCRIWERHFAAVPKRWIRFARSESFTRSPCRPRNIPIPPSNIPSHVSAERPQADSATDKVRSNTSAPNLSVICKTPDTAPTLLVEEDPKDRECFCRIRSVSTKSGTPPVRPTWYSSIGRGLCDSLFLIKKRIASCAWFRPWWTSAMIVGRPASSLARQRCWPSTMYRAPSDRCETTIDPMASRTISFAMVCARRSFRVRCAWRSMVRSATASSFPYSTRCTGRS